MNDNGKKEFPQLPQADLGIIAQQKVPDELEAQALFENFRSPIGYLKYATLFFLKNGNIDQAIICVKALIEDSKDIFHDLDSITVNTKDVDKIAELKVLLPNVPIYTIGATESLNVDGLNDDDLNVLNEVLYELQQEDKVRAAQVERLDLLSRSFFLPKDQAEAQQQIIRNQRISQLDMELAQLDQKQLDLQKLKIEGDYNGLLAAASDGNIDSIINLIKSDVDLTASCSEGLTALHYAARFGQLELVKYLVSLKKFDLEAKDINGRTPLSWAAMRGQLKIVVYLHKAGALIHPDTVSSGTPLILAVENDNREIIEYIAHCSMSLSNVILSQVLKHLKSDQERVAIFNTYSFYEISIDQWKVICRCYKDVQFNELKLCGAKNLQEKEFEELLTRSKRLSAVRLEGESLLTDNTLGEKILNRSSLEVLHIRFAENFRLLSKNGLFSKAENLTELVIDSCTEINMIDLKAHKLQKAYFGGCPKLKSINLIARNLQRLGIANCVSLSSIEVAAKNCVLDFQGFGSRYVEEIYKSSSRARFFNKCDVQKIDVSPYNPVISMLGLTRGDANGGCGTSWLCSRLIDDQLPGGYRGGTAPVNERRALTIKLSDTDECEIEVWDHRNNDYFRMEESFLGVILRQSNIIIITISYENIKYDSIHDIIYEYNQIKNDLSGDCYCIIAGTMVDLASGQDQSRKFEDKLKKISEHISSQVGFVVPVCITSAKDNTGIDDLRAGIADGIMWYNLKLESILKRRIL